LPLSSYPTGRMDDPYGSLSSLLGVNIFLSKIKAGSALTFEFIMVLEAHHDV